MPQELDLSRDDKERIAKGLMAYKRELKADMEIEYLDGIDYAEVEISEVDELARRLNLDRDYFEF